MRPSFDETLLASPVVDGSGDPPGSDGVPGPCAPPELPGPPVPPWINISSSAEHPNLLNLNNVNSITRATWAYLVISNTIIALEPLCSWTMMIRQLDLVEADRQQDFAELQNLCIHTKVPEREIQTLKNKFAQLKLALNSATVCALQDNLDFIRRDFNCLCATRPAPEC